MSDDIVERLEAAERGYTFVEGEILGEARAEIERLRLAIGRLDEEGRLDCVVAGQTTHDGQRVPLCPEIISDHRAMCAGCAAKRFVRRTE